MTLIPENMQGWSGNLDQNCLHVWKMTDDESYPCQCSKCGGAITQADALNMVIKALQAL